MNIALLGKKACDLDAIKKYIVDNTGYENIVIYNKPSELIKDNNTKIIFISIGLELYWEMWKSFCSNWADNYKEFDDEIIEFSQLNLNDCDYIIDYNKYETTELNEKICNYITSTVKGGGE